jgi:outer membrane lipoprotein SlyB
VTGVPGDSSIKSTDNEGELLRKGPDKKRLATNALIGAGVGAVSGAAAGGGKGAAIGAVAGAGLGTGSGFIFHGADLKLEKETNLEIRLNRDLMVPRR